MPSKKKIEATTEHPAGVEATATEIASKMLDRDVEDMKLVPLDPGTEFNVGVLEKELKAWLKRHRMGKILNEVVRRLPIYGSVGLRKVKGGADVVDLRKLINDQAA